MKPLNLALSVALAFSGMASANTSEAPDISSSSIERITVTGSELSQNASTGLKTLTPLLDVPQSLTVISREQLDEQAFTDVADILRYTPGASIGQGEGHRDQMTIRGQNTTADFFIDGLRDDVQYFRPLYNLQSVEILRGANALLFGRGGGGGVINRVTKTAKLGEQFSSLQASLSSFGSLMTSVDTNLSIDNQQSLRINGFYESMENHRDFFEGDRFAINPTYTNQLNDKTKLVVSYEYVDDDRMVDRGVPSLDGQPLAGYDDTFFGDPDFNRTTVQAHIARARIDHQLNQHWNINATVQYADYDKMYRNLYPIGFDNQVNTVSLDGYIDQTKRENLIVQFNAIGQLETGDVTHTLLVGAEYGDQDTQNDRQDPLFADSNDDQITFVFSDPLNIPDYSFPAFVRDRQSAVEFTSVYFQDEMQLTEQFILVAGLRYDEFSIDVLDQIEVNNGDADGNNGQLSSSDSQVSPRVGIIYKPLDNVSIYASMSQSFLPRSGDQFLSLSLSSQALDAEEFKNSEIGVKWDFDDALSLTAAVFEIERENGTAVDPTNPEQTILTGTKTKGFELHLSGNITDHLNINAGYSYLDGEEMGRVSNGELANRELSQVPTHMLSLWSRYEVTPDLDFGLGVTHQSEQYSSLSNSVTLPSYTRVDAAVFYALSDAMTVQLNIENVLDEEYYPAAHNDNNISTGEPMNARVSVTYNF